MHELASSHNLNHPSEGNLSVILTRPPRKAWSFVLYGNASGRSTSSAAANIRFSHLMAGCQAEATSRVLAVRANIVLKKQPATLQTSNKQLRLCYRRRPSLSITFISGCSTGGPDRSAAATLTACSSYSFHEQLTERQKKNRIAPARTCLPPSLAFRRLAVHSPTPIKLMSASRVVLWTANTSTRRRGPANTWPKFQN